MLGNDLIDLGKARTDSNWRRKGFLTKLFTTDEQEEILNATCPETMVWLFWSMKEAAYKIVNRKLQRRFFSPHRFKCNIRATVSSVTYEHHTYFTQSEINADFIHTIATNNANDFQQIRTYLLPFSPNYLADFNLRFPRFKLTKDAHGIPQIADISTNENHYASISHHGIYLGIACH